MLRNYFKIALRNLWKGKAFSFINIFGLSIGISASLVIWMIVYYDLSFDKFHPHGERIYRVVSDIDFGGTVINTSATPFPLADVVRNEINGVEKTGHTFRLEADVKTGRKDQVFPQQRNVVLADPGFFDIYSYEWIYGSPEVLKTPYQVVLTEDRAAQYFPGVPLYDVIGRMLTYNDTLLMKVSGLIKAFKGRTHFTITDFMSLSTVSNNKGLQQFLATDRWDNTTSYCNLHLLLKPGVIPEQIDQQFPAIREKYLDKENKGRFYLQPLSDFHFNSKYDIFDQRQASLPTLYGLAALAVFLLLLGCINFINIQTAQAGERAREIGIRKTMGSSRGSLVRQFLGESLLLTLFAAGLSILLVPIILRLFSTFIPEDISMAMLTEWQVYLFIPLLVLVVGLLAGFYPAWVLARFEPVLVLKNQVHGVKGKARLRQVLTISQFVVALVLIIATVTVSSQIRYAYKKDMGYRKDARLFFNLPPGVKSLDPLKDKFSQIPDIAQLSSAFGPPSTGGAMSTTFSLGEGAMKTAKLIEVKHIDDAYISLYQLKLVAGRNLLPADTMREVIINETFARDAGFSNPSDAVGQLIADDDRKFPVVGVVADFHAKSMHQKIKPVVLATGASYKRALHVALRDDADVRQALERMKAAWASVYPHTEFKYRFVDEAVASFYKSEARLIKLLSWATGIAIFISGLGLLGLAIYATRQRTKEIGIRKVLGASVVSIVTLLSRDVVKLVLIALVIATPLAWYAMYTWLADFAYRIPMPWWVFPAAGFVALLLAVLTVGLQSMKAALINPVKSLRTE